MSARPSVLVFGSVNVDLVMRVSTLPISGETVLTDDYQPLPGGKGANQALAARRAGADSVFIGAVGDDAHGILALALLAQDGVDLSYIVKTKRRKWSGEIHNWSRGALSRVVRASPTYYGCGDGYGIAGQKWPRRR